MIQSPQLSNAIYSIINLLYMACQDRGIGGLEKDTPLGVPVRTPFGHPRQQYQRENGLTRIAFIDRQALRMESFPFLSDVERVSMLQPTQYALSLDPPIVDTPHASYHVNKQLKNPKGP
jgi:hypothetical protein